MIGEGERWGKKKFLYRPTKKTNGKLLFVFLFSLFDSIPSCSYVFSYAVLFLLDTIKYVTLLPQYGVLFPLSSLSCPFLF